MSPFYDADWWVHDVLEARVLADGELPKIDYVRARLRSLAHSGRSRRPL